MSKIYADNSQSIGNTPLVKLNHIVGNCKSHHSGQDRGS